MAIDKIIQNNIKGLQSKKMKQPELTKTEIIDKILTKGRKVLGDDVETYVPENGKFSKVMFSFDVPDTNHEAIVAVVHDEIDPRTYRRLLVGVHNKNSDRLFMEYPFKGTKAEIMDFLKDEKKQPELHDLILSLSQKTDDYYSAL